MATAPDGMEPLDAIRFSRWGSIRYKLVLFVTVLVVLTTLALTLGAYVFVHRLLLNEVRDRLTLDAANWSEMLYAYIQQQHERVALVASRTKLRQLLHKTIRKGFWLPIRFRTNRAVS